MYGRFGASKEHLQRLKKLLPVGVITNARTEGEARYAAENSQVIIGQRFLQQTLPLCKGIKWIQSTSGGIDQIASTTLIDTNALVTRCPIFSETIALHGLSMAFALQRRLTRSLTIQHKSEWKEPEGFLPRPKKVLIIGMGEIGRHLARMLRAMGLTVIGAATSVSELKIELCDRLYTSPEWKNELAKCDLCFLCLPSISSTRRIFNAEAISSLPKHAIVVNLGRGDALDESALFKALIENKIAGAGLDVLENIPAPDSPIWKIEDLIISRKTSSFFSGRQQHLELFIEDQVRRFIAGESLKHQVSAGMLKASIKEGNQ